MVFFGTQETSYLVLVLAFNGSIKLDNTFRDK